MEEAGVEPVAGAAGIDRLQASRRGDELSVDEAALGAELDHHLACSTAAPLGGERCWIGRAAERDLVLQGRQSDVAALDCSVARVARLISAGPQ